MRSVNVDALFSNKKPEVDVIEVALGKNTGIRDLAAVSDGLLVLSGPTQKDGGYALHHWAEGDGVLRKLLDLTMPDTKAKAETILLLDEREDFYRLLVMYDGLLDGGRASIKLAGIEGLFSQRLI